MNKEIIELTNKAVNDLIGIDLTTYQEYEIVVTDKHELYKIVELILKSKNLFTEGNLIQVMNLGLDLRQQQLRGTNDLSGLEVLDNYIKKIK
jgi:hypothetical protein